MLKLNSLSIPQVQPHVTQGIQPIEHQLGEGTETYERTNQHMLPMIYVHFKKTSSPVLKCILENKHQL